MLSTQQLESRLENLDKPNEYVRIVTDTFRMRDALGRWFDYRPLPYQVEWHRKFILANPRLVDHPHRIWHKCRGIGATAITMMDLLMMASTYHDLTIPVASMTGKQALRGPIWWGIQLADNTKVPGLIPRDPNTNSEIRILSTGSTIFLIPGSSPQTLRTYRTPVIFYDEFDWCDYQRELLDSGESCMSEGGQATVVSTIQNVRGEFQRLIDNRKELNYWVHKVSMFDEEKFDVTKPIPQQISDRVIRPIAPWVDVNLLERQRKRDPSVFLRENMCTAPDVGVNFLSWDLVAKICSIPQCLRPGEYGWTGDIYRKYTELSAGDIYPYTGGWDFARYKDNAVVIIVKHTPFGVEEVFEQVMRGSDTVTQNALMDLLFDKYKLLEMRVDMTGSGTGLYDYAYDRHGSKVDGVHFSRNVEIDEETAMAKTALAINLRTLAQDDKLKTFDYLEMKDDLNSVPYDLKDPGRTAEGAHGDRFWALALAAWPPTNTGPFAFYR